MGLTTITGASPWSVTVDPSGRFAYVANGGLDSISTFTINPSTGALTSVGAAVPAGIGTAGIAVSSSIQ